MGDNDSLTLKVSEYVFGLGVAKMWGINGFFEGITEGVGGAGNWVGTEGEERR